MLKERNTNGKEPRFRVNPYGYIERKTSAKCSGSRSGSVYRNWWLIKFGNGKSARGLILPYVSVPKEYIGKKIRLKAEVIN